MRNVEKVSLASALWHIFNDKLNLILQVNQFIRIVEKDLERGVGSNLESVLAQCMFFGQSFSRIGADFRNLLAPLFLVTRIYRFDFIYWIKVCLY